MPKNYFVNEGGILGFGHPSTKISDEEYKLLKAEMDAVIAKQPPEQQVRNKLIVLKNRMENYLEAKNPDNITEVGYFIEELLKALGIKNKTFADFIEISKYDLSKIINGKKKINNELALKIGYFFDIKPYLLIAIQNKNEQIRMEHEDENKYKKYRFENFLARR